MLGISVAVIGGKLYSAPKDFEIENGEAKIVSMDGEIVWAYRDEHGELHVIDITCTHIGC
jgi:nitrite reductase/ring-hydroxylating ferredoxin subunit